MDIATFCAWLEAQPFAVAILQSLWLFPTIESVHVVAITLVVGSIAMVDLRLLGFRKDLPVATLTQQILPFTWAAFAIALLSGLLLFSSQATLYYGNAPFRFKLLLLALAGLNMLVFHGISYRDVAHWGDKDIPPLPARFAGGISLVTWISIVFLGRWIAFV